MSVDLPPWIKGETDKCNGLLGRQAIGAKDQCAKDQRASDQRASDMCASHMRAKNQGGDPLEPFGVYDTRTAQEIYQPEVEDAEDGGEAARDPARPQSGWWKERAKRGERKAEEEEGE